ncbi:MAG: DEAD/DEAH box helicase, partial [Oscillospiraceae bacterium]
MGFNILGLNENIIKGLQLQEITQPTPVQTLAIPTIAENNDVIIQSETGSGKTLTYLLPLYAKQADVIAKGMQAIILVPTKELAMQIQNQVELLSKNTTIALKSVALFGDVNIKGQILKLKEKPQLIIGTCGRILELIQKKNITAHTIQTIVFDEADKLLTKSNMESIKAIRKAVMRDTQVVFLSASITNQTLETAKDLSKNLQVIKTSDALTIPDTIVHQFLIVRQGEKIEYLRKLINILKPQRSLIFINSLDEVEKATQKMQSYHYKIDCIHSSNKKQDRQRMLVELKDGTLQYLITTDLLARGLHIDDISTVFSLSLGEDAIDYLHRCGRTGRTGHTDTSICIVSEE